jgi:hypothetical protein
MCIKCIVFLVLKSCILVPENVLRDRNARHEFKKQIYIFLIYCSSCVSIGSALLAGHY